MSHNQRKAVLICLTGIDGSGKTTLSRLLLDILHENSIACKYVWCGWKQFDSPFFQPLILLVRKTLLRERNTAVSNSAASSMAMRLPRIFVILVLADYFLKVLLQVSIPLKLGRNVVCDRYVYDAVTSLGIDLGYSLDRISRILKMCLRILPRPDFVFLLDVPAEFALRRKNDIVSVSKLLRLRAMLLRLGPPFGMYSIDGTRSIDEQAEYFANIFGFKAEKASPHTSDQTSGVIYER